MKKFLKDINYFVFEIWVILRTASTYMAFILITMLVQDKLCTNEYGKPWDYCQRIGQLTNHQSTSADEIERNHILADSAKFNNYKSLAESIPVVIWSLFLGSFLDNYIGGTRLILLIGIVGDLISAFTLAINIYFFHWSTYLILIFFSLYWFTGGLGALITASYRSIVITTNEQFRPLKFIFFGISMTIGQATGTYLAGQLMFLRKNPDPNEPQLRTYYYVIIAVFAFNFIALILVFLLPHSNIPTSKIEEEEKEKVNQQNEDDNVPSNTKEEIKSKHFLKVFFDLDHFYKTYQCFVKPRENNIRIQIFVYFAVIFLLITNQFGSSTVQFQFAERVYSWSNQTYTEYSSMLNIIQTILLLGLTSILIRYLKASDETMILLSILCGFVQLFTIGTILKPYSFFVGQSLGSLLAYSYLGIRNKISKIVPANEIGKIFSIGTTFEASLPFFASIIYTSLFSASIEHFPGLTYQFGAFLMVISLSLTVFVELYCNKNE
ncbi:hypothetical protein RDWZM_006539 [Blomia tropicalis]|uniref:Uncharacterized protein n=1 Tax=Blomia tropicalis TaxID=40697 RepID=A0A9Q0MAN6_BLOTA|nr:hypothetical protein RDWZM_006539 [Blomia tropicalis]